MNGEQDIFSTIEAYFIKTRLGRAQNFLDLKKLIAFEIFEISTFYEKRIVSP